jgi:hypothetical protein
MKHYRPCNYKTEHVWTQLHDTSFGFRYARAHRSYYCETHLVKKTTSLLCNKLNYYVLGHRIVKLISTRHWNNSDANTRKSYRFLFNRTHTFLLQLMQKFSGWLHARAVRNSVSQNSDSKAYCHCVSNMWCPSILKRCAGSGKTAFIIFATVRLSVLPEDHKKVHKMHKTVLRKPSHTKITVTVWEGNTAPRQ